MRLTRGTKMDFDLELPPLPSRRASLLIPVRAAH